MNLTDELRAQADRLDDIADQAVPGQVLPEPRTLRVIAAALRERADSLADAAPDLMTAGEVAELFGVQPASVSKLLARLHPPVYWVNGYPRAAVEALGRQGRLRAPQSADLKK